MPCQSSERDAQQMEKHCYHWQPRPLHPQLPTAGRNKILTFKLGRRRWYQGRRLSPSRKGSCAKGPPEWDAQGIKCQMQTPFLNPDPFNQWYRIENVAMVKVNGESCMDNGVQINTIMPGYVENHSLNIRPLSDLLGSWDACIYLGNAVTWPISYIIIQIQVDRVLGYDEDQIALVFPDLSNLAVWVPVILGTPTIGTS